MRGFGARTGAACLVAVACLCCSFAFAHAAEGTKPGATIELNSDTIDVDANLVAAASKVKWAGVRSSPYGIDPFPTRSGWVKAMDTMAGYFSGSTPTAVWLVGEIDFDGRNSGMDVGFPNPGGTYDPRIHFAGSDRYEKYLKYFDSHGIRVFLQFEPGFAGINDLIDATYKQYGNHPCVVGFGIDVEWYRSECDGCENAKVSDSTAKAWEKKVKSLNKNYRLFLKHYDKSYLPPNYRGKIIFIDDSLGFENEADLLAEFKDFADFFYPNDVMFQIGYKEDKVWWKKLAKPIPKTLGKDLAAQTSQKNCGIIWVDFTLRDVLPTK